MAIHCLAQAPVHSQIAAYFLLGQLMNWLKKFLTHYVLYGVLLLTLCLGIFPFVILYSSSSSTAEMLDRFLPGHKIAEKIENVWTLVGIPYDFLVMTVG